MPQNKPPRPVSPVSQQGSFARVDQGVDWNQSTPFVSIGDGVVYSIGSGFAGPAGQAGSSNAVYIKLDHPVRVNGRVYDEIYYAETTPLVKEGQRVKAGQAVTAGGDAEIGFASGGAPLAPLVGGLGSGTQPSQEGQDFLALLQGHGAFDYSPHAQADALTASSFGTGGPHGTGTARQKASGKAVLKAQGFETSIPTVTEQDQLQPFSPQESVMGDVGTGLQQVSQMPVSKAAQVWQQLASQQSASPETRLLAGNSHVLIQNLPSSLL